MRERLARRGRDQLAIGRLGVGRPLVLELRDAEVAQLVGLGRERRSRRDRCECGDQPQTRRERRTPRRAGEWALGAILPAAGRPWCGVPSPGPCRKTSPPPISSPMLPIAARSRRPQARLPDRRLLATSSAPSSRIRRSRTRRGADQRGLRLRQHAAQAPARARSRTLVGVAWDVGGKTVRRSASPTTRRPARRCPTSCGRRSRSCARRSRPSHPDPRAGAATRPTT